jgi:hypothetical protein
MSGQAAARRVAQRTTQQRAQARTRPRAARLAGAHRKKEAHESHRGDAEEQAVVEARRGEQHLLIHCRSAHAAGAARERVHERSRATPMVQVARAVSAPVTAVCSTSTEATRAQSRRLSAKPQRRSSPGTRGAARGDAPCPAGAAAPASPIFTTATRLDAMRGPKRSAAACCAGFEALVGPGAGPRLQGEREEEREQTGRSHRHNRRRARGYTAWRSTSCGCWPRLAWQCSRGCCNRCGRCARRCACHRARRRPAATRCRRRATRRSGRSTPRRAARPAASAWG